VLLLVTALWPVALLAAPYAATHHAGSATSVRLAAGVYILGSLVCHQRSERSFHVWGVQLPVCARCAGVYGGAPLGVAAVLTLSRRRALRVSNSRAWSLALVAASLPTMATLVWEWFTPDMVSGAVRAAAGVSLGIAVAAFVAVASSGKSR
jgi:uncharacterized membrane protein